MGAARCRHDNLSHRPSTEIVTPRRPPPDDPHRCEWPGDDGDGAARAPRHDLAYVGLIYGVPAGVLAFCALIAVFFFLAFQHAPL